MKGPFSTAETLSFVGPHEVNAIIRQHTVQTFFIASLHPARTIIANHKSSAIAVVILNFTQKPRLWGKMSEKPVYANQANTVTPRPALLTVRRLFSLMQDKNRGELFSDYACSGKEMRSPIRFRILIADDHRLVAEACAKLLEAEFDVLGTVRNGYAMVETATVLKPDVIVVDVAMPLLNGLDAGQRVKAILPETKLVYLTMNPDPEIAAEAFNRGASAYLLKTCAESDLRRAVREVLRHKSYLSPAIQDEVNSLRWQHADLVVNEAERLSMRQREVLKLLVAGNTMREISKKLNLKYRTVCYHKYRIMHNLRAKKDADLVRYALRNNIAG